MKRDTLLSSEEAYKIVLEERAYQNKKHPPLPGGAVRTVGDYVAIIGALHAQAEKVFANGDQYDVMGLVRKLIATGLRAIEEHNTPRRD